MGAPHSMVPGTRLVVGHGAAIELEDAGVGDAAAVAAGDGELSEEAGLDPVAPGPRAVEREARTHPLGPAGASC